MAGRFFRTITCYQHESVADHPYIKIRLSSVARERWPEDLSAPIDTGFSGALMLPSEYYEFFMIGELPRKLWKEYRTMTGPLQMRVARAFIQVGEEAPDETLVETPLLGAGKLLVGRAILKRLAVLLDGPGRLSCLMQPVRETDGLTQNTGQHSDKP
jgi:predicted aspartyl protease